MILKWCEVHLVCRAKAACFNESLTATEKKKSTGQNHKPHQTTKKETYHDHLCDLFARTTFAIQVPSHFRTPADRYKLPFKPFQPTSKLRELRHWQLASRKRFNTRPPEFYGFLWKCLVWGKKWLEQFPLLPRAAISSSPRRKMEPFAALDLRWLPMTWWLGEVPCCLVNHGDHWIVW